MKTTSIAGATLTARSMRSASAIEAASDRLRAAIRKKVTDGNLMDGIREVYKAGWKRIKAYFMVGFPGETPDDIRAIHSLCHEMSRERRRMGKGPAQITGSVGWLVPKPYTPFQWAAQPRVEYFIEARRILADMSRRQGGRNVSVRTHDPQRSVLEAVLSRGDRRLASAIEAAYRSGARFDGWDECFKYDTWLRAFDATGIDPDWYAHRERPYGEILPWDHIRSGPARDYLEGQYSNVYVKTEQPAPPPGVLPLPVVT